jgi:hypothetical protein
MPDIDLGRAGQTDRYATERDIRMTLEIKSSDPISSAFELLVAPNARWYARLHSPEKRASIGQAALERFIETNSVIPGDYRDLLPLDDDPFAFDWAATPFATSPVGRAS